MKNLDEEFYSLKSLNLSNRAYNSLMRNGIDNIEKLCSIPKTNFETMSGFGKKTLDEVFDCIDFIKTNDISNTNNINLKNNYKDLIEIDSKKYVDEKIEELNLSKRSYNCLKRNGINKISEIMNKDVEYFLSIKNMGKKSVDEIISALSNYKLILVEDCKSNQNETLIASIFDSLNEKLDIDFAKFNKQVGKILEAYTIIAEYENNFEFYLSDEKIRKMLLSSLYIKECYQIYLIDLIRENIYGCDLEYIFKNTPKLLQDDEFIDNIILNLLNNKKIIKIYDAYFIKYNSIFDESESILKESDYNIFIKRINNYTLEQIGIELNLTRERVRQKIVKILNIFCAKKIKFKEDLYLGIYKNYMISEEDFKIAFDDCKAYSYLKLRYSDYNNYNYEKSPLIDALSNDNIPKSIKRNIEKAVYKDYVKIGKEYIHCTRDEISNYVLKNFARKEITFDDFKDYYFMIIDELDKDYDNKLFMMERGYENKLAKSNSVLWKYGKKFRYYNINSYDFEELLTTLNLNQYRDVEYSTLKFYNLYPELMRDYDIQDEYELHNLLKKICDKDSYPLVDFCRMPNIVFGNADRDSQVLDLLLSLSPISNYDFAIEYEKEYGISANTVLANYMKNFEKYFYNGIYKIDAIMLPDVIANKLKQILTKDFYYIDDIYNIYRNEFPNFGVDMINPYSIKSLGFRVYSKYVISDRFSSAIDYFHHILTNDDFIDTTLFPSKIKQIVSYSSHFYKLKSDYEIIEISPNKLINIRWLNKKGIIIDNLFGFIEKVYSFTKDGDYFTIQSLEKSGFDNHLRKTNLGDWFYGSILTEAREKFSYLKIGGNKVFVKGIVDISFESFIEYIVFNEKNLFIELNELKNILIQKYQININVTKLLEMLNKSSMFYDKISKIIFADYDIYCENKGLLIKVVE